MTIDRKNVSFACGLIAFSMISFACQKEVEQQQTVREEKSPVFEIKEIPFETDLPGKDGVENTIKAYNMAMRNALLADPYFKVLRKYATDEEVQRVYVDVDFDMQVGRAIRSWQKKLVFDNISVSEDSARVETTEIWDFEFLDLKTREITEPMKTVEYRLKYMLEKEDGRWVVSKVREREPSVLTQTIELKPKVAP